jgi:hypothetical protein
MKVWGCNAYVSKTKPSKSKYEPYAWCGFLVGWNKRWRAYEIMDQTGEIIYSNDVIFDEFKFSAMSSFKQKVETHKIKIKVPKEIPEETLIQFEIGERAVPESESKEDLDLDEEDSGERPSNVLVEDTPIQKKSREAAISEKVRKAIEELEARGPQVTRYGRKIKPTSLGEVIGAVSVVTNKKDIENIMYNIPTPWFKQPPKTYSEAQTYEDRAEWDKATKLEYDSLINNGTWELVERKPGMKVLKGKWVLDYKLGEYNELLRRKARYVIKGYAQSYGVDYFETHSPVVKAKSIRIMLILAAIFDLELKQIDFDTAFLNGKLEEQVYMEQPEGYEIGDPKVTVCRLVKSLYGLKQAARVWYKSINS